MSIFRGTQLWLYGLVLAGACASNTGMASELGAHKYNPYHEQQLNEQIRVCASGVLACTDDELRCAKQQELCQLLIRTERYDEAMQVANNIYKTNNIDKERKALHHYLIAEIYNRKMRSSRNLDEMEKNRKSAIAAAQEVVDQKYPSKWGISEHARKLIRDLSNSNEMNGIRQRVASRQGSQGDAAKEAIAEAQRKYLDSTQGHRTGSTRNTRDNASFTRLTPEQQIENSARTAGGASMPSPAGGTQSRSLPNEPSVSRTFSPVQTATVAQVETGSRLSDSGLLTSQPGSSPTATSTKGPLTVNGQVANNITTADDIAKHNLEQLLEAARKRKENAVRSTYATGEGPSSIRR